VLRAFLHTIENPPNEFIRYGFLEEIAHRINKDDAGLFPLPGQVDQIVVQGGCEVISV